jgi:ABC-type glutathione transport system ATPase component
LYQWGKPEDLDVEDRYMKQNQNPSSPLPIVQMKRICKSFGRVQVLKDVELAIFPGEVHVLAGENGAGKSTLIKILAGVYPDFEGEIEIEGKTVHPHSPQEATALELPSSIRSYPLSPLCLSQIIFFWDAQSPVMALYRIRCKKQKPGGY